MRKRSTAPSFLVLAVLLLFTGNVRAQEHEKIQIMFVGFDHLSQLSDGSPTSDVFSKKNQAEIAKLNQHLKQFSPDMIMVEVEPEEQDFLDSLYSLYHTKKLDLAELEHGSGETYQVGFRLGRLLNHRRVYGVDHYQATSQSLLNSGDNIALFQEELKKLQHIARPLKQSVQQGSTSLYDYVVFLNRPTTIALTHNLFFNLPAYVVKGEFSESGTNTVDMGKIDQDYIGAEFISLFYNRNLKIYSNILNTQLKGRGKRILVLMGQTHVGVLQDLFEGNSNYTIVSPLSYLEAKE